MNDHKLPPLGGTRSRAAQSRPQGGGGSNRELDVSAHVAWIESIKPEEHLSQLDSAALVEHADKLGRLLSSELKANQLRRLLTRVNALSVKFAHGFEPDDVPLLKVQLAYAAARQRRSVGALAKVLMPAIDRIHNEEDFRWFARFVEAIVAYHKYYGGTD